MLRLAALSFGMAVALSAPLAHAQEAPAAEATLQRAIANCLLNYHDPQSVPAAFRSSGFALDRDAMGDSAESAGVLVYYAVTEIGGDNTCSIEAGAVSAGRAEAIGRQLAEHFFAGKVENGGPEGKEECPAISIFAPRSLMVMRFYDAGNAGTCNGSGGASIALSF